MTFAEAWPEIETFLLETAKAESPEIGSYLLPGVGNIAVIEVESTLGRKIPKELQFYLRKGPFIGEWLSYGWNCELLGHDEIDFEKSKMWGDFPEAKGVIFTPLVIGQCGSGAFVTDLDDMKCPVFYVDEMSDWMPQLMAHSLADFLYLLSYQEMLSAISFAKSEDSVSQQSDDRSRADYDAMKDRLMALAPDCLEQWNLWQYGVKDV